MLLHEFGVTVASQDGEKLILVKMENVVRQLEELSASESGAGQQRSVTEGPKVLGTLVTRCDSTVADESETAAGQQMWSPPAAAAADEDRSRGKKIGPSSSSSSGVVTSVASASTSIENMQNTSQGDENHNVKLSTEVSSLKAKVETLRADLRRSDKAVSQLKHHIELNTTTDGSQMPAFNPQVIVTLVHEVERLHAELDKLQAVEGKSDDGMKKPGSDGESSVSAGGRQPVKQSVDRSTSPLSIQNLDSTLTCGNAAAIDSDSSQRADNIPRLGDKLQDKLPVKDDLVGSDKAVVYDRTSTTAHLTSSALFNIAEGELSFIGSPSARNALRQSILSCLSPFEPTNDVNQRSFAELQAEVARLRHLLKLAQLENSRLLERSARESVDSAGRPSVNPQAEMSLLLDGSLVRYSASGDITVAAGFLKKLVNVSVFILVSYFEFS